MKLSVENIFTAHKLKDQEIYLCLIQTTEEQPEKNGFLLIIFISVCLTVRKLANVI
ncbi:hypothetical protein RGT18_14980 [Solobacterium moorei]|nr:hypothetical protein RGT18_14980 [Solobacterium moorei]